MCIGKEISILLVSYEIHLLTIKFDQKTIWKLNRMNFRFVPSYGVVSTILVTFSIFIRIYLECYILYGRPI